MDKKTKILSYALYFLGTILVVLCIIPSGVRSFLWGAFGMGSFFAGFFLMKIGFFANKRGFIKELWLSVLGLAILLVGLCGFFQIVFAGFPESEPIVTLIEDGKALRGGGILALFLGWAGKITTLVFMGLGIIVVIISLLNLPKINMPKFTLPKIEKKPNEIKNFDISLDPMEEQIVEPQTNHAFDNEPIAPLSNTINSKSTEDVPETAFERALLNFKHRNDEKIEVQINEPNKEEPVTDDDFLEPIPVFDKKNEGNDVHFEDNVRTTTAFSNFNPYKYSQKAASAHILATESKKVEIVNETKPITSPNLDPNLGTEKQKYNYPSLNLLNPVKPVSVQDSTEIAYNSKKLVDVLNSFGVPTKVVDTSRGPTVTRYELMPEPGVRINRITGLSDDIAMNLAATSVRIEAPIPGKSAVGIEIPNRIKDSVGIKEVLQSEEFQSAKGKLTVALGKDIAGRVITADISKMPHLLVAGTTGSGKSVCLNAMIISLLYRCSPEEVKFLMIDPKMVEFSMYNGMPHLAVPVVSDPKKAAGVLGWAVKEMENRYLLFSAHSVRDLESYNRVVSNYNPTDEDEEIPKPLPNYVIIIDELADLMTVAGREVENSIQRLTQKARAAGMHLVVATQRPSVDVITGVIKNNIPSRIALTVSSQVDSRTIIDTSGAEKLLGHGDMLFNPIGSSKPVRIQGCFVSDDEIDRVKEFVSKEGANYDETIEQEIEKCIPVGKGSANGNPDGPSTNSDCDPMLDKCIEVVIEAGMASTSLLQRKCALGYARAARIIDEMEARGIVGPFEGSKPRPVLLTKERWMEMKLNKADNE